MAAPHHQQDNTRQPGPRTPLVARLKPAFRRPPKTHHVTQQTQRSHDAEAKLKRQVPCRQPPRPAKAKEKSRESRGAGSLLSTCVVQVFVAGIMQVVEPRAWALARRPATHRPARCRSRPRTISDNTHPSLSTPHTTLRNLTSTSSISSSMGVKGC